MPQDYKEAVLWYRKAAGQGNAQAQNNLGVMYDNGLGVPQDYKEAVFWYRKAAEQGDEQAQFNLGAMYDLGQGVPQDLIQAYMWYNLAGEAGNKTAASSMKIIETKITSGQVEQAQALAREWLVKQN